MRQFLRLIRWPNLLIITASMYGVWIALYPSMDKTHLFLTPLNLSLLVLATVLIAAGGYVINDYFDIRIDAINRPESLLVSNTICRRQALIWHSTLSISGLLIYVWLGLKSDYIILSGCGVLSTSLLWFYSTHFKRMPILGNVVVALLLSLSIFQLAWFETSFWRFAVGPLIENNHVNPFWLISGVSIFAFLLNWMREIVKDMEDIEGDANENCRTYPILYGLKSATRFVQVIGILLLGFLCLSIYVLFSGGKILSAALLLIPVIHSLFVLILLDKQATPYHYGLMSRHLKIIMVEGLLLILLVNFL